MTRIPIISFICLVCALLVQTNPKHKAGYLDAAATLVQQTCCEELPLEGDPQVQTASTGCRTLQPLVKPLFRPVLNFYTPEPRNYVLFTIYSTQLPSARFQALGIGGQYIFWPSPPPPSVACDGPPPGWFGENLPGTIPKPG